MSTLKVLKIGNSLGVLFPKEVQDTLNISEGDVIDVTSVGGNKVILETHLPHHNKWVFKNTELSTEDREWIDADLGDDN